MKSFNFFLALCLSLSLLLVSLFQTGCGTAEMRRPIIVYIDSGVPYTERYYSDDMDGVIAKSDSAITDEAHRFHRYLEYNYKGKSVYVPWMKLKMRYADSPTITPGNYRAHQTTTVKESAAVQCTATTQKGARCKNTTTDASLKCYLHR